MSIRTILLVIGISLLSAGCDAPVFSLRPEVRSLHPLYAGEDTVFEPALVGTWATLDGGAVLEIQGSESKPYVLAYFEHGKSSKLEGHLVRLGESLFLDLYQDSRAARQLGAKEAVPHLLAVHTFYRLRVEGDVLRLATLNREWLEGEDREGESEDDVEVEVNIALERVEGKSLLTTSPQDLQAFILEQAGEEGVFEDLPEFHRPSEEVARFYLGNAYRKLGSYEKAIAAYKQALKVKPDYAEAYLAMGEVHRAQECYDDEIASYRKAIEVKPDHVEAHRTLGDAYSRRGLYAEAIVAFLKVVELRPDDPDDHINLGQAYARSGLSAEAGAAYEKALEVIPEDVEELELAAETFTDLDLFDHAIAAHQKALQLEPDHVETLSRLGLVYLKKEAYKEALASYQKLAALEPEDAVHRYMVGVVFLEMRKYESARREFRRARRLETDEPIAQHLIAISDFLEGKFSKSVRAFEKPPATEDLELLLLLWHHLSLRHVGAEAKAQQLLEDNVKNFQGEDWETSLFRFHQGKLTESDLLAAADDGDELCQAYFYAGYQYFLQGSPEKARDYFQKATSTGLKTVFDSSGLEYLAARTRLEQLHSD